MHNLKLELMQTCMLETVKKWVPTTLMLRLWIIGWVEPKFQLKEKAVIQKLIKGEKVSVNESGLSKREWNELMTAFDLKEKLI